jgi:plastocyanin
MTAAVPGSRLGRRARWTLVACTAALSGIVAAACAPAGTPPTFPVAQAKSNLTVQVVDQVNDVGRSPSVAIDSQGRPVVSYLLYQQPPKPGVLPAPIVAGVPQPPAVMVATRNSGIWQRQSVTPQKTSPEQGDAPKIATKKLQALPGVTTALAVDAQGKDHVVWSTPSGLFYSDDTGGSFSDPEQVAKTAAVGGSIAVGADGTPWVAFYGADGIHAASRSGGSWKVEAIDPNVKLPITQATRTQIGVDSQGNPVVAYGADGTTVVATRSGGKWTISSVAGQGGYGGSLALDKSGNPHLAYYDRSGNVLVADGSGGSFQATTIAQTKPGPNGPNGSWSTGIAVDDQGNEYVVFADTATHDIDLAVKSGAAFQMKPVQDSHLGANPSLAVDPQGRTLAVAWYDTENLNLNVAVTSAGGLVLAFSPLPTSAAIAPTASAASCQPSGTTISVVAKNTAFDKKCFAAAANTAFSIDFNNQDPGTPHNFDIYSAAPTEGGQHLGAANGPSDVLTGPGTTTYKVAALKAGTYYFQCDIHPTAMFGQFVVAGK